MSKLSRADLWTLEDYAVERPAFREAVIAHKKHRRVALGDNAALYFEDAMTMKYQVQEMLRTERIFDPTEIEEELAAYNPLIPDGSNWKATFMLEFSDVAERKAALASLTGVEHKVWVQVEDCGKVFAIANEDLERSTDEKTSAVHFVRFELDGAMIDALKNGAALQMGTDHPALEIAVTVPADARDSLANDLALPH